MIGRDGVFLFSYSYERLNKVRKWKVGSRYACFLKGWGRKFRNYLITKKRGFYLYFYFYFWVI